MFVYSHNSIGCHFFYPQFWVCWMTNFESDCPLLNKFCPSEPVRAVTWFSNFFHNPSISTNTTNTKVECLRMLYHMIVMFTKLVQPHTQNSHDVGKFVMVTKYLIV